MSSYEDLLGSAEEAGKAYFEGGDEFALRAEIEGGHYWHVHRRDVIRQELEAFAPPDAAGKLLEIGCGIGTVATSLNEHGYRVDYAEVFGRGLEIAAARARERLGERVSERRFLRVDATQALPLEGAGYEGMLLFDVIEHLPDDLGVLRNVHAALVPSPSAFVMVTVPAFQMLWSPWDDVEKHKRRYTRPELTAVLERAGFSVVRSTYFFGPLFFAALGMKGVRAARAALGGARAARGIGDLVESKSTDTLNRLMLGVLGPERGLLARGALPFGTSVLAIGRRR